MILKQPPLKVILIDDEPLARERARRILDIIGGTIVVEECDNGKDGIIAIEKHTPDVVLLDISMPELDGMRVIQALDDPPAIILTTAYEQYAIQAFELEVSDYILKPFSAGRLQRALAKIRLQYEWKGDIKKICKNCQQKSIPVDTGRGIELIPSSEISAAHIVEGVVFLLRSNGDTFCFSKTLQDLEAILPIQNFIRVSRSAIINLQAVQKYSNCEDGTIAVELRGGYKEHISRRRTRFFRAKLT